MCQEQDPGISCSVAVSLFFESALSSQALSSYPAIFPTSLSECRPKDSAVCRVGVVVVDGTKCTENRGPANLRDGSGGQLFQHQLLKYFYPYDPFYSFCRQVCGLLAFIDLSF